VLCIQNVTLRQYRACLGLKWLLLLQISISHILHCNVRLLLHYESPIEMERERITVCETANLSRAHTTVCHVCLEARQTWPCASNMTRRVKHDQGRFAAWEVYTLPPPPAFPGLRKS
jgi:hypothetical protein